MYKCNIPGYSVTATSAMFLGKHKCKTRLEAIAAITKRRPGEIAQAARNRARLDEAAGDYREVTTVRRCIIWVCPPY